MVKLEMLIEKNTYGEVKLMDLLENSYYSYSDLMYIIRVLLLPKNEFINAIKIYDDNKFVIDEVEFIKGLSTKNKTDYNNIVSRIQDNSNVSFFNCVI